MAENGATSSGTVTEPSPQSLRKQKQPAKLFNENEASLYDEVSNVKTFHRRIYFDTLDTVTNCIKTRFSQPGYRAVNNIEQLILNVVNRLEYQNQLEDNLSDYGEEVNHYRLSAQLQILKTKFVDSNEKNHFCSNKSYEKQHWCTNRFLLGNNCFVKIISCVASNKCCKWTISFFNALH